jgi:hypothetical protein
MRARLSIAAMIVVLLCSCDPIPLRDLIAQRVVEGTTLLKASIIQMITNPYSQVRLHPSRPSVT